MEASRALAAHPVPHPLPRYAIFPRTPYAASVPHALLPNMVARAAVVCALLDTQLSLVCASCGCRWMTRPMAPPASSKSTPWIAQVSCQTRRAQPVSLLPRSPAQQDAAPARFRGKNRACMCARRPAGGHCARAEGHQPECRVGRSGHRGQPSAGGVSAELGCPQSWGLSTESVRLSSESVSIMVDTVGNQAQVGCPQR